MTGDIEKEGIQKQQRLTTLLKELSETQEKITIINFGTNAREARKTTEKKVQKLRQQIEYIGEVAGGSAKKLADDYLSGKNGRKDLKDLEEKIKELQSKYEEGLKEISIERGKLQKEENQANLELGIYKMLRRNCDNKRLRAEKMCSELDGKRAGIIEKLYQAIEQEDSKGLMPTAKELTKIQKEYQKYKNDISELMLDINDYDRKISDYKEVLEDINKDLKALDIKEKEYIEKNRALVAQIAALNLEKDNKKGSIPKQNIAQRALGAIFYKVRGQSKIKEVMKSVKDVTIQLATEDLPEFGKDFTKTSRETGELIGERVGEIREASGKTIVQIAQRIKKSKDNAIKKAEKKWSSVLECVRTSNASAKEKRESQNNIEDSNKEKKSDDIEIE